jgi:1,4-dihydroxy-2-naphthoyl-CoA hydrolase
MAIWKMPLTLEEVNTRSANTAAEHLGMVFSAYTDNSLSATMPIDNRTCQPLGLLHGGISAALAETVASSAANYCVDQQLAYCVGLDINANHIRGVNSGQVTATATPFHLGQSTQVWDVRIVDDRARLVCIARMTMAVITRRPTSAEEK